MSKITWNKGRSRVLEIQLVCTPEEWKELCIMFDTTWKNATAGHPGAKAILSLQEKISAINKRLVFASSTSEK